MAESSGSVVAVAVAVAVDGAEGDDEEARTSGGDVAVLELLGLLLRLLLQHCCVNQPPRAQRTRRHKQQELEA